MTLALSVGRAAPLPAQWPRALAVLGAAAAAILVLLARDAAALAHIWWTSTTFGHCLFVGPVIAWLAWTRRHGLARLTPTGWAPGLLLVALGGVAWATGDAAGVTLARHAGLVAMLDGAVVAVLGPAVARGLAFPLAYTAFLVPFGEGLEASLQRATVALAVPLLRLAGVPVHVDGVLIAIPDGTFEVAQACSGDKFVIAMLAFGVLVANLCFASWRRRAAFLLAALVVPVLANGMRAAATIWAAHLVGVAAATGYDHIVFGWLFFGAVMAGVLALGWRWFDRSPDDPAFDPSVLARAQVRARLRPAVAAVLSVAVAAAFPVWAGALARAPAPVPDRIDLPVLPGWIRAPLSTRAPWQPYYPGADHLLFGRYRDDAGNEVDVGVALFGHQREGAKLLAFGTGVLREEDRWVRVADAAPIADGAGVRIVAAGADGRPVERLVVTWYRVGDAMVASGAGVKLETLKARLLGGSQAAVAVHLSAEARPGHDPARAIRRLLAALGPVDRFAAREAGGG